MVTPLVRDVIVGGGETTLSERPPMRSFDFVGQLCHWSLTTDINHYPPLAGPFGATETIRDSALRMAKPHLAVRSTFNSQFERRAVRVLESRNPDDARTEFMSPIL
jgi:hypothetical protein